MVPLVTILPPHSRPGLDDGVTFWPPSDATNRHDVGAPLPLPAAGMVCGC